MKFAPRLRALTLGIGSLLAVSACRQEPPTPPPAPAQPTTTSSAVATTAATPPAPQPVTAPAASPDTDAAVPAIGAGGESLSGEVSGLAGTITDFRVRVSAAETIIDMAADVLFAFDQDTLAAGAEAPLQKMLAYVQKAKGKITVIGHTDAKGDDAYNMGLSLRRAQAVGHWLSAHGVAADRLTMQGKGEAEPVAPNTRADGSDNPEGRAKNRRVSVVIAN